ncbi:MAG: hypothetical protein OXF02_00650 [Simkaniaceae bacterium]|nr:hypothetical protein [Simkaniaceae bacterium]
MDYALEVRKTKSMVACAKEVGTCIASLSNWIRWECETYQIFSCLNLDSRTLRGIDYRELLTDLRSGIGSVTISDYTGGLKFSSRKSTRGIRLENVPAQEEVRAGHPYFVSPERGERRVFTENQKARVVDYRLHEFDGKSFSRCARECNLCKNTLIDWVGERRGSKQTCPDMAEVPENSPEAPDSDPDEDPFLGVVGGSAVVVGILGVVYGGVTGWVSGIFLPAVLWAGVHCGARLSSVVCSRESREVSKELFTEKVRMHRALSDQRSKGEVLPPV